MKKQKCTCFPILLLLLCTCLIRCNVAPKEIKHIVLVNSYGEGYFGYGDFEKALKKKLQKLKIDAKITSVFLDCDLYNESEEIERMQQIFDSLYPERVDLIVLANDPAGYSGLKTRHPLLNNTPVILTNINYPNQEVLLPYRNSQVYVLRDTPDFLRNIDFIRNLHNNQFVNIIWSFDYTFLGKKSFSDIQKSISPAHIQFTTLKRDLIDNSVYTELSNLFSGSLPTSTDSTFTPQNSFVLRLMPFRYMTGLALLNALSFTRAEQRNNVFLMSKLDVSTRPLPQLLGIPAFGCVYDGFNKKLRVIGGYMATEELSVEAVASLIQKLFSNTFQNQPKIVDIPKEHVLDWEVMRSSAMNYIEHIPSYVRIINYPWTEKHRNELYGIAVIFVLFFFALIIGFTRIRQRTKEVKKDTAILKKMHEQLSLSISGGNISSWQIKNKIIDFDENFTKLCGSQERSFDFTHYLLRFHHPDDIPMIEKALEEIRVFLEMRILRARLSLTDKNYQWYEIRCSGFVDKDGEIVLAGIIQNIQSVIERENELIRTKELAEKAELKQSFLTNMSHEIRTPLNAIVGFTNILLGEEASELDQTTKQKMLTTVNRNNELLLKLIGDVLDISRLDSNNYKFTIGIYDLAPIIAEIYHTHQVIIHAPLEFNLQLDESEPTFVKTDKLRLIQVLSNFLSNANKFTETGYITLGCWVDNANKEASIYVEDTGKGIDEEQQKMIFERFYKTDEFAQGTGLGLSICKVIIEKLSGRISVESEPGKGSRFTITLPMV